MYSFVLDYDALINQLCKTSRVSVICKISQGALSCGFGGGGGIRKEELRKRASSTNMLHAHYNWPLPMGYSLNFGSIIVRGGWKLPPSLCNGPNKGTLNSSQLINEHLTMDRWI